MQQKINNIREMKQSSAYSRQQTAHNIQLLATAGRDKERGRLRALGRGWTCACTVIRRRRESMTMGGGGRRWGLKMTECVVDIEMQPSED